MQDFRNLDVWKKAHELALDVHKTIARTKRLDVSIRAQMMRATTSIAANIVEGCGKATRIELARFADISIGSSSELEYWLLLARDLGQFANTDFERLTRRNLEVRKMLFGLRRAIRDGSTKKSQASSPVPVAEASNL